MSMRTAVTHQAPPGSWSQPVPIPMDAWREDDRFVIALDLPGIPLDAVDVQAHGRTVTVRTERRPAARRQGARARISERHHGKLERRIQLADTLDAGRIEAHLADGVLTLTIPLASAPRRRKVTVHNGLVPPRPDGRIVPAAA